MVHKPQVTIISNPSVKISETFDCVGRSLLEEALASMLKPIPSPIKRQIDQIG